MSNFNEKLKTFMKRSVCYGAESDIDALIEYADSTGCEGLQDALKGYADAMRKEDYVAACRRFAAVHFFTCD